VGDKGALGLKDDAALLNVPEGYELVITKDALVEGVHFTGGESPDLLARKALRVNLSDLAAMGARPYGYFLALMLPASTDEAWLQAFAAGLAADQKTYGITLLGGDTTRSLGGLSLSITALGLVPRGQALLRSGAVAGEDIYVSGTLGDAALALQFMTDSFLQQRYQLPEPRLALGERLRGIASSCMDISDGLMQDLGHICKSSGVAATIYRNRIPLSEAAKLALPLAKNPQEAALAGGDDYELLFTAPSTAAQKLGRIAHETKTAITCIGNTSKGSGARVVDATGKEIVLSRQGYAHF
jgi:thiamine-monophosphate kinase